MKRIVSEDQHQAELWRWFYTEYPEFRIGIGKCLLFHNFNNPSNKIQGAKLKSMGLCAGIPDMFLAVPRGEFGGLYLELKVEGKKPQKHQKEVMQVLSLAGYSVDWSDNLENSKKIIIKYLEL